MKRRTFLRSTLAATAALSIPGRDALTALYQPVQQQQVPPDLSAITGDGKRVTLRGRDVAELAARLRGRLLLPGDDSYDDARRVLNPSFDKRPALIAQVSGPADIRTAVDFARDNDGLLLAVKCGGHSASGKSTCDWGMMIDLSRFRSVRVDPVERRARVTGGSLLGDVDHETAAYDLVMPLGTVSHTGVGGLVTGGGFGRVARRFGLSIDNVTAADVVTADGQLRRASAEENADLFWGVRGGGGNFGVVTSFEFRLHSMPRQVIGGQIMFPFSKARDVLSLFADYGPRAPDELDLVPALVAPPGDAEAMAGFFSVCYSGPPNRAEAALAPIRRLGTPVVDDLGPIDYVKLQRMGDYDDPRALGQYLKAGFIREMPAALINAILEGFEPHPGRVTVMAFQQGGGAIARVAPGATAFVNREIMSNMLCELGWPARTDPTPHIEYARKYWATLERFTHGFYVNDPDPDLTEREIQANYRQNLERLVAVKNEYDPRNLFRLNTNIRPTVAVAESD